MRPQSTVPLGTVTMMFGTEYQMLAVPTTMGWAVRMQRGERVVATFCHQPTLRRARGAGRTLLVQMRKNQPEVQRNLLELVAGRELVSVNA